MAENNDSAKDMENLAGCIAAIVESLKMLGYVRPQYLHLHNECGETIIACSPDEKTNFQISVKTWRKIP